MADPLPEALGPLLREARARLAMAGVDDPALDARLIVEHFSGTTRTQAIADPERSMDGNAIAAIEAALRRRAGGEPVHRILGYREFYGLRLSLSPETLEPRPDTEILVDTVLVYLKDLAKAQSRLHILDMGTGTGAICLALLSECPDASGVGSDISADALLTARSNAERNGLQDRFQVVQSSWFENIQGSFHAIVSNPPYIASNVIHDLAPEVTKFDPVAALDGGPDGLDAYHAIAKDAARFMRPGGFVGLEIGYDQRNDVMAIFEAKGFKCLKSVKDYGQNDRVLVFALT